MTRDMIATATDRIARWLAHIAGFALVAMMLLLMGNIVLRLVASPIHGAYEAVSMLAVVVAGLSLAEAQAKKTHVSIDVLVTRLPRGPRLLTGLVVTLISLGLFIQLATSLWMYGTNQQARGSATESLHIPTWPSVMILFAGVVGLVIVLLGDLDRLRRAWRSAEGDLADLW